MALVLRVLITFVVVIIKYISNHIKTVISLPASKSESNRILVLSALSNCKNPMSIIGNLSEAEDTKTLKELLSKNRVNKTLNVGHAGTTMRFLTAYFALNKNARIILTGSNRMQKRPIKILVEALRTIGADISYLGEVGYPPLEIIGKDLLGGLIHIDSSVSSQYLSALLMIGPLLENGLELSLLGKIVSEPYLDMTIDLMKYFGVEVVKKEKSIQIKPQKYSCKSITVESDWSAASYWYEIAALSQSCEIELKDLNRISRQGDQELVELFKIFGVKTSWNSNGIVLSKSELHKMDTTKEYYFNLERTPDLAQTIICTCAGLGLKAVFNGLSTLKIKETDRLLALKIELNKFDVQLNIVDENQAELLNVTKIIKPKQAITTYEDHRMAMSFAPLALVINEVKIENATVVKKSYPNYWSDLDSVFNVVI